MKILLVNTYDTKGGAARATGRLFQGLKNLGAEVNLMVQNRDSEDPEIMITGGFITRKLNFLRPYIDFAIPFPWVRKRLLFSTSLLPDQAVKAINQANPDLVHLNWIAGGLMKIESLAKINRPVVWTLHDLWAITGGCHSPVDCTRYLESCGRCPILHSSREHDMSRSVFNRKQRTYATIRDLTIVTPSQWLAKKVRESPLLGNRRVEVIPNGLDTSVFKPVDQEASRERLHIPAGKKIILFGAVRATQTPLKGFGLLVSALKMMTPGDHQLIVFGSQNAGKTDISGLDVRFFGEVTQTDLLVDLYSAADVVAVPSRQEVFGQAASEALACGTPVVAFGATGLTDIVAHKETGYLAEPFDPGDLAEGICWICADDERHQRLSAKARMQALEKFDIKKTALRYLDLYREILKK